VNTETAKNLFDYKDGSLYWKINQGRIKAGSKAGTPREKGHIQIQYNKKMYREHSIVWMMFNGENPSAILDHINGNPSDNRIENLRLATNAQNLANRGKNKNNTSGFKGVYLHNQTNKWVASIKHLGKKYSLGCYENASDAHQAYKKACVKLNGDFAKFE
jgi:hypothetical protein